MLRLHVLSDLHTEMSPCTPGTPSCDAVVLAGDIGVGAGSVAWIEELCRGVPAVYVAGNHEYYQSSVPGFALHKPIAPALASDLESLIEKTRVNLWIHGHTHWCTDYDLHGTLVLSNQKGYPHARVPGFCQDLVITV